MVRARKQDRLRAAAQPTGQPYGARQQAQRIQTDLPLTDALAALQQLSAAPRQAPPLSRPSERPSEPLTAGMATGPGPGPEAIPSFADLSMAPSPDVLKMARWLPIMETQVAKTKNPLLAQLVRQIRGRLPADFDLTQITS